MIDWPDVAGLVKIVRPMTSHGGHFLVETTDVLQYYLPNTTWQQWSNTLDNSPEYYQQAIARHYFSVVVLSFNQTLATDYAMRLDLSAGQRVPARGEGALGKDSLLRVGVPRPGVIAPGHPPGHSLAR